MDLIEKQNRPLARVPQPRLRLLQHESHLLDPHPGGIHLHEVAVRPCRDEVRQRRLPRPRRPVKNHARQPIRLNHPPQQLPRPQNMPLPRKLLQRARPHPRRQRHRRRPPLLTLGLE